MLLVSYQFGLFLLLLTAAYYLIPKKGQWVLLLAASYLFYLCGGPVYILYPMITTGTTWFLARRIGRITAQAKQYVKEQGFDRTQRKAYNQSVKKRTRRLLILGLLLNFGILAVLKYMNFMFRNINGLLSVLDIPVELGYVGWLLPLGISYYTFQSMGYLIDVYNGKYEPEGNVFRFALFVSFFPQLVAGPISRFDQIKQDLFAEHSFNARQVKLGAERMLWGYFKKLVIADRLGPAVTVIISSPAEYNGIYALLGMIGYTVWMYADFAGGIDIVIGAAQILGVKLPENFDRPFLSVSLAEFWRRWHMTLMQWLREYIFFPVSTSRFSKKMSLLAGKFFGKSAGQKAPVYVANLTVWFIAGIWHGASWNFIAWGMANCIVMLISAELAGTYRKYRKKFAFTGTKGYRCFEIVRTFSLFCCLEMFEYYPFFTVFAMLGNILTNCRLSQLFDGRMALLGLENTDWCLLLLSIAIMALSGIFCGKTGLREKLEQKPLWIQYTAVFGLFLVVLITGAYGRGYDASQFIYNQF